MHADYHTLRVAGDQPAVCDLTWLECRVKPIRLGDAMALADMEAFLTASDVARVSLTAAVYDRVWRIRATQNFKLADALHLDMRETVKEVAQLDGAFIVTDAGAVQSACQYINASSEGIKLPLGLGSRHMAAASVTKETRAIAVVASESAVVRVFDGGEIMAEILREVWLMRHYGLHLHVPCKVRSGGNMTVASREE